ncbi:MAG: hypothetical protein AAF607_12345 [Pseudomonadota bacterium]
MTVASIPESFGVFSMAFFQKLIAGAGTGARLRPDEWKSGDRLWLENTVTGKYGKYGDSVLNPQIGFSQILPSCVGAWA